MSAAVVGDGAHVVANLPYNIGTALLLRWLSGPWPPWWRSLTLMFQKEVAERIVARRAARPTDGCRSPPMAVRRPRIAMDVSRSAFVPPPKVDVRGRPHRARASSLDGVSPRASSA